jgi:hypothetical protein
MSKLDEVIEQKAKELFNEDVRTEGRWKLILSNCTLNEIIKSIDRVESNPSNAINVKSNYTLASVCTGSNGYYLIEDTVWPKLKDKYIIQVVKNLEKNITPQPGTINCGELLPPIFENTEYVMEYTTDQWTTELRTVKFKKLRK